MGVRQWWRRRKYDVLCKESSEEGRIDTGTSAGHVEMIAMGRVVRRDALSLKSGGWLVCEVEEAVCA